MRACVCAAAGAACALLTTRDAGFVDNAEVTNSRAAMIGFFALLLLEAVTGKGILELMGIEVGNGIDIGF